MCIAVAMKNIGAQVKSFYEGQRTKMPFILEAGFSKGMEHLPVRFHVLLTDLTRWSESQYYHPSDKEKAGFGNILLNHFVLGLDILPTDFLYISAGIAHVIFGIGRTELYFLQAQPCTEGDTGEL